MGKSAVLTGLLALIMLLTGCSTGGKEFAIGEAAMLEIIDGSTGETIQVTDPEAIRYIADNLNAMGFSHAGTAEGAGWTYGLTWFDHQGKPSETIFLMGDGYTILYEGRYAKGMEADQEIDLAFVESLLANGRAMDWGIALSAVDVQPTGLTLVIAQSGGHPTGRLQYGSDYTLEVLQDGVWEQVPYAVEGDVGWTAEAYLVSMEASVEENVQWAFLYGSLPPGTYRIRKTFMDFRETGDYDTQTYWAAFAIR